MIVRGDPALTESRGPWNVPPAPPPPPRRLPIGVFIWLGLLASVAALFWAATLFFPQAVAEADTPRVLLMLGTLAVVSSGLVYARRLRLGLVARNAAIWLAIGAAIVVGYTFRGDAAMAFQRLRGELAPEYAVAAGPRSMVLTSGPDGHFYVMGQVNGAPVRFIVDTGASAIVLSPADAQRAGVDVAALTYGSPGETANGVGYMAQLTVPSLQVGPLRLANVPVGVNKAPMSASLLGMSFLKNVDIAVHDDRMTLTWRS